MITDRKHTVHAYLLSIKVDNLKDDIIWKQERGTILCFNDLVHDKVIR